MKRIETVLLKSQSLYLKPINSPRKPGISLSFDLRGHLPRSPLARPSHTRRHVPHVRSPERAALAARDGDGTWGDAGKRMEERIFFL